MTQPRKSAGIVRTIAGQAAEAIRARILSGALAPGAPLRQEALAAELGISRIPVREALLLLEAEGLVRIVPHKGAVVAAFSLADMEELFALRRLLEPRLLAASAPRLEPADFAALRAILAEYSRHIRAGNVIRWGALNTAFHLRLYVHAAQPRTEAFVSGLLLSSDRYARIQLSSTDGLARAEAEHAALLALCEEGKVGEACALLEAHIAGVGAALQQLLAKDEVSDRA
jgi:DNA-binding GntR family transcriptional regulator